MNDSLITLANMHRVVRDEANKLVKGGYIEPICGGVRCCALGALYIAEGLPRDSSGASASHKLGVLSDGYRHTISHRLFDCLSEDRPGLREAWTTLNAVAKERLDATSPERFSQSYLNHTSMTPAEFAEDVWGNALEALFEATDLGREGLLEVIEQAAGRITLDVA